MNSSIRKVNLAGREIGCSCHACAFFHTEDQSYKVLLPFIREGFSVGARKRLHVTVSFRGIDDMHRPIAAQRANTAKDQFLATLSHELRTPLNAMVGWLSMLRRPEVMTSAGVPKAWAAIDRNADALIELVEDLLDISRIATSKIRLAQADWTSTRSRATARALSSRSSLKKTSRYRSSWTRTHATSLGTSLDFARSPVICLGTR